MRRLLFSIVMVGVVLALPTAAFATLLQPPRSHQLTGTLASKGAYSFSVQKPGRATQIIDALTVAADNLTAKDYPYVWGGGHGVVGIASIGISGAGHDGRRRGYDCSGSVAAVLAAAGLWPAGAGVPNDLGVVQYLRQRGEIAPGAGSGPHEVTIYDEPDVHIFMNINGRFFGTSDGAGGGDRSGGPGWLNDGAWDVHNPRFRRYHIVPRVLRTTTSAGYTRPVLHQTGGATSPVLHEMPGEKSRVGRQESPSISPPAESRGPFLAAASDPISHPHRTRYRTGFAPLGRVASNDPLWSYSDSASSAPAE